MNRYQVAETILSQLGGRRFLAMTGARVVTGENSLAVKLPKKAKDGINSVRIFLEPSDTYRVEFSRFNANAMTDADLFQVIATESDVYADQLTVIFESVTGLAVSL